VVVAADDAGLVAVVVLLRGAAEREGDDDEDAVEDLVQSGCVGVGRAVAFVDVSSVVDAAGLLWMRLDAGDCRRVLLKISAMACAVSFEPVMF